MNDFKERKLGFGIIGCNMGLHHAWGVKACKDAELKAVCDSSIKLSEISSELGLSDNDCYVDYRDMLKREDIDAIVVATPDQVHEVQTISSLHAGKHVMCEKPMALTVGECKNMIKASENTGRKLMIGQICRYTPGFIKAKALIDKGEIGELFYVESEYAHDYSESAGVGNWRLDKDRLRYPVIGGGCHSVDLLRWIAGDPYEVFAYSNHKVLKSWPVDDCTIAVLRFPDNVIGKVMVSIGCKRNYTMRSAFYGDKGTIIADNQLPYIKVYKSSLNGSNNVFDDIPDRIVGLDYEVQINNHNAVAEIREFVDIIRNGKPVVTDGIQGAHTVAACIAIVESAARGDKVVVDYGY